MKAVNPRWARIQELFNQAADMTLAERKSFLDIECKDDVVLRKELDDLLAADAGPPTSDESGIKNSLLTQSVNNAIERTSRDRRSELVDSVMGAYRLTAVLGYGGTGTVYLGERADRQYSAQVAIKVVENSLIHDEVVKRFTAERQILASLNHPHIARLLDAGEASTGQPYLVMEYVHGETIDHYCDSHKLTVKERLELFLRVCAAVQYAHQNLIVHRDLKPGNILVTPDGTPKLLDFGIAKLVDVSIKTATAEPALTRINDRVLTPEYASPEQILGQNVTTASDVYALGIVLYELLVGTRPYKVHALSQLELERVICVIDPPRPSQLLQAHYSKKPCASQLDLPTIATTRNTSPKRLKQALLGDIDAIILRALRKEPAQRYRSVEQFVDDIQRHLQQQPVEARQGNWLYFSKRFVHRHVVGVISSTAAILALACFALFVFRQNKLIIEQRDLATQQTARAENVSDFMLEVFDTADPFTSQGNEVTAKQLLDKAGERLDEENYLAQQPEVKVRLLEAIGRAYQRQNQSNLAVKYLEDSLRLQRNLSGKNQDALPRTLNYLGIALRENGRHVEADAALNEAKALLENDNKTSTSLYIQVSADIGLLELHRSNPLKAQQSLELALRLARQIYGNTHPETATILTSLAQSLGWQNKLSAAVTAAREAVTISHTTLPQNHPDRAMTDYILGDLLLRQGNFDEAAILVNQALNIQKVLYGDNNPTLAPTIDALALIQYAQGKPDEAEQNARSALRIKENALGKNNIGTVYYYCALADLLIKRNKFTEAKQHARTAIAILTTTHSTDHQYMASAEYLLAATLVASNQNQQAEPLLRQNIARWKQNGAPAWRVARTESLLGTALTQLHKIDEGKILLQRSYQTLQAKGSGASAEIVAESKQRLQRADMLN
jgi:serine/threonine protein kinase/Flp pilus assembly protein TadD